MSDTPHQRASPAGARSSGFLSCGGKPTETPASHREPSAPAEALPALRIESDLDHVVGPIRHEGSVWIGGDVLDGVEITAAGDVEVAGDVQGAHIIAGGDIRIDGVVGGPGAPVIEAGGSVSVQSARFATILAGGDLSVGDYLARSTVTAYGHVRLERRRGHLTGGQVRAVGGLSVKRLGSSLGRATHVALGRASVEEDHQTLDERLHACAGGITRIAHRLAELAVLVDREPSERAATMAEIRRLMRERERLSKLQTALRRRARMFERTPRTQAYLRVEGLVLRGVWVDVGKGAETLPPGVAVSIDA